MALVSDWLLICVLFLAGLFGASLSITEQASQPSQPTYSDHIARAPSCWEDEVVVLVIGEWDMEGSNTFLPVGPLINMVGCVPADNLPGAGFRP